MSGFLDTGPVATGILAIGRCWQRQVLVWHGFPVVGKVMHGIQATGEGHTLMGMYGHLDIATLRVIGIVGVGENLRDRRRTGSHRENHNSNQNSGSFKERATIFT
jgi:hypothetical protein